MDIPHAFSLKNTTLNRPTQPFKQLGGIHNPLLFIFTPTQGTLGYHGHRIQFLLRLCSIQSSAASGSGKYDKRLPFKLQNWSLRPAGGVRLCFIAWKTTIFKAFFYSAWNEFGQYRGEAEKPIQHIRGKATKSSRIIQFIRLPPGGAHMSESLWGGWRWSTK